MKALAQDCKEDEQCSLPRACRSWLPLLTPCCFLTLAAEIVLKQGGKKDHSQDVIFVSIFTEK